jgi:hypothetical protein
VEYHAPPASLKHLGSSLDFRLHRGNETVIVQCKHWDTVEVQLAEVNELLSTMLNEAATRCVLVTRGRFSPEARAVPRRQPRLQLVDGDVLRVMLKLPGHLDTSVPGVALPSVAARKGAAARRTSGERSSKLLPILLFAVIAALPAMPPCLLRQRTKQSRRSLRRPRKRYLPPRRPQARPRRPKHRCRANWPSVRACAKRHRRARRAMRTGSPKTPSRSWNATPAKSATRNERTNRAAFFHAEEIPPGLS